MLEVGYSTAENLEVGYRKSRLQEKNSISIYAFVLILCMFTMYVCCIVLSKMDENRCKQSLASLP